MIQNLKFSIIIPAYNSQNYIKQAIESVLNQSYRNLEFIIVNDGSTDDSQKYIDKYTRLDPRIKSFFQENQGQSVARNFAMEHAK